MADTTVEAMAYLANGTKVKMSIGDVDLTKYLKSLPDFAQNKEQVETTVLSSMQKTYIAGLQDPGELEFGFNYTSEKFKALRALSVEGEDGKVPTVPVSITLSDGMAITFNGQVSVDLAAASSGSVMEMNVKLTVTDEIKFA